MHIGIFDSGIGGLILATAIANHLPTYNYTYLGDTKRVPYGNRSQAAIYEFTREGVEFLFQKGCALVILACNTASAEALRTLQQEWLPTHYPDRRILGVLIPTAEAVSSGKRVGIVATRSTVASQAFVREIHKLQPSAEVLQQAAPLLVPLIENDELSFLAPILNSYLDPLVDQQVEQVILGCTHYAAIKESVRATLPNCEVLAQDEIVPPALEAYLHRHPEITERLSTDGIRSFYLTDLVEGYADLAQRLTGTHPTFQLAEL